jgi:hypothetical protein
LCTNMFGHNVFIDLKLSISSIGIWAISQTLYLPSYILEIKMTSMSSREKCEPSFTRLTTDISPPRYLRVPILRHLFVISPIWVLKASNLQIVFRIAIVWDHGYVALGTSEFLSSRQKTVCFWLSNYTYLVMRLEMTSEDGNMHHWRKRIGKEEWSTS